MPAPGETGGPFSFEYNPSACNQAQFIYKISALRTLRKKYIIHVNMMCTWSNQHTGKTN